MSVALLIESLRSTTAFDAPEAYSSESINATSCAFNVLRCASESSFSLTRFFRYSSRDPNEAFFRLLSKSAIAAFRAFALSVSSERIFPNAKPIATTAPITIATGPVATSKATSIDASPKPAEIPCPIVWDILLSFVSPSPAEAANDEIEIARNAIA